MTVFKWKPGNRFKSSAQAVGEHVGKLERRRGKKLDPAEAVADARNPRSPWHRDFTWDDGEAAEKQRRQEARMLLNSLLVVSVNLSLPDHPATYIRAMVSVRDPDDLSKRSYRTMAHVMSDKRLRAEMLRDALREFQSFRDKYRELQELEPLFSAGELLIGRFKKPGLRRVA